MIGKNIWNPRKEGAARRKKSLPISTLLLTSQNCEWHWRSIPTLLCLHASKLQMLSGKLMRPSDCMLKFQYHMERINVSEIPLNVDVEEREKTWRTCRIASDCAKWESSVFNACSRPFWSLSKPLSIFNAPSATYNALSSLAPSPGDNSFWVPRCTGITTALPITSALAPKVVQALHRLQPSQSSWHCERDNHTLL